ncbi:amino acid transporter AVT3B-like [Cornus florida]|uniref:amino acid transporter AVT3B-like n=1 Tax=Cornus florida TaxID=4283 RepID=UPI00289AFC2D|nr:amino acid transporter AVT3B-like [Cornus florida]
MGLDSSYGGNPRSVPREDTPLLGGVGVGGNSKPLSSQPKSFANVFIAIVGAGVLGLPYTFLRTGWVTTFLMIFGVAGLTNYCMMLLVYTRRKLEPNNDKDFNTKINSFGDLGFAVCGSVGRFAVDTMIVLSHAGFCIGYIIFISNTLVNLFNSSAMLHNKYFKWTTPKIWGISAKSIYIWGGVPFQLGLNSIHSLTLLAPLSIFADIVDLGAMGVVMVEDVVVFLKDRPAVEPFGGWSMFFYALGVTVYSFEGVGMALPLESEMKDRKKFGKVLCLTMFFIASMYGIFGLLGYFAFGENTKDIITANMGRGLMSSLVQLGLCVNLFFTFPLMMNPVYEVVGRRFCGGRCSLWVRWLLVIVVNLVALLVPNFTDFLSLVGSSICCVLGFVLPSLFHYLTFKDEMGWKGVYRDVGIMILGIALAVTGTWSSLAEIFSVKV